jgi:dTDP-4-dehydrorhamnose reductase
MNVFVLGHRGMLGHVVARYLAERGHNVITTETRYSGGPDDPLVNELGKSEATWIINCIGKIPQKTTNPAELFEGNFQLPVHIKTFLRPDQRVLHASTDCVFSGKRGNYPTNETPDPYDNYGLSKLLGESIAEAGRCQIIRTSIIGPELGEGGKGLMAWFLSQKGPVNGFTNHSWNGITTLEWAKVAEEILTGKLQPSSPLFQSGSATAVTKYELLKVIGEIWPHPIKINPMEAKDAVNRTLVPDKSRASLNAQIQELRGWYHRPKE